MNGRFCLAWSAECAARLCHLHEAEHALIHARAARGRDHDDTAAMGRPIFDYARDAFASDRPHGGGEEAEIHHCDCHFVALDERVPAQHRVNQSGAVLIFTQAILVARHALELEGVDRGQPGVELDETFRIAKIRDPLLRREREMVIAARTDAVVFHELDFVHDLAATGTFLPETLRHLALFCSRS